MLRLASLLLLLAAARHADPPVRLVADVRAGQPVLVLQPAPGIRVGARAVPVLELRDGRRVTIGYGARTADSAYFAEPPWASRPDSGELRGVVRLGFCRPTERYCRVDSLQVRLRPLDRNVRDR